MVGRMETLRVADREVYVYLPPSYNNADLFPVMYVQDGSYLFEDSIQELERDFAAGVTQEVVFVGIKPDNRYREYTPWYAPSLRPEEGFDGEGDNYLELLTTRIMPFITANYRVAKEAAQTGLTGGSLGALISLYAAFRKPEHFGRIALMSASFWYENALEFIEEHEFQQEQLFIYMYVGELEAAGRGNIQEKMVPNTKMAYQLLADKLSNGRGRIMLETDPAGVHEHRYFNQYFPNAMRYIFPGNNA